MNRWFRFFLGSPQRFVATTVAIIVIATLEHFAPGTVTNGIVIAIAAVLNGVLAVTLPFLPLVGGIAIVVLVFRAMWRGVGRK